MIPTDVLDEAFGRIPGVARGAVEGLPLAALTWQVEPGANTIAWLVWHLARVQDHHVSELADQPQLWVDSDIADRFGLVAEADDTGFGHDIEQVRAVRPDSAETLLGYLDAVTDRTRDFLLTISAGDLDDVVDEGWDPPVTMGVRLVSVIGDGLQHAGQAAFLRGCWQRTGEA